jgi:hypothetical protein
MEVKTTHGHGPGCGCRHPKTLTGTDNGTWHRIATATLVLLLLTLFANSVSALCNNNDFKVNSPNGGEIWSGTKSIQWYYDCGDTSTFQYKIYYKAGSCGGDIGDWTLINTVNKNTKSMSYSWNTATVSNGKYCIGIRKTSGTYKDDKSNGIFNISNTICSGTDADHDRYSTRASDKNKMCCGTNKDKTCKVGVDCNDNNAAINPGVTEEGCICFDGADNDCDGGADESDIDGCFCRSGVDESGGGEDCADPVCRDEPYCVYPETGIICSASDTEHHGWGDGWNVCSDNFDNDGDTLVDMNDPTACRICVDNDHDGYNATGASCGPTDCNDNNPAVHPGAAEACNGVDDDCDAATQDGAIEGWLNTACDGADTDLCQEGTFQCVSGSKTCSDTTGNIQEVCDGVDNDCNPSTQDGAEESWLNSACDGADTDLCKEGTYVCTLGAQTCTDDTGNNAEICDGLDNDCNSATADGSGETWYNQATNCGTGDCASTGQWVCSAGVKTDTCQEGPAGTEVCDASEHDEDCDGTGNEGCECVDGPYNCGIDEGECAYGTQTCTNGQMGQCIGGTGPTDELCDGLDNDCDGAVDEDLTAPDANNQYGVCAGSKKVCDGANSWVEPEYSEITGYEDPETTCDGLDNDCDNSVDEGGASLCPASDNECQEAVCGGTEGCGFANKPATTECGEARDCNEQCIDQDPHMQIFNPTSGHDTCNANGVCVEYRCMEAYTECDSVCGAQCVLSSECTDTSNCEGSIYVTRTANCDQGTCSCDYGEYASAGCSLSVANCGAECDSSGDCAPECEGMDYVTYTCSDQCSCTASAPKSCDDGVECTDDSCDTTAIGGCVNTPDNSKCQNGGTCDGTSGQVWTGTCDATLGCTKTTAPAEKCDGTDNDCDGAVDDDFTNLGESCTAGIGTCQGSGTYVCSQDMTTTECNAVPTGTPSCSGKQCGDDGCGGTCGDYDGGCQEGYVCSETWQCRTVCGDGIKAGSEECDDGNVAPGDGCSSV